MTDPLLRFRDQFPILARTNYLISNSLGAMPGRTRDNLIHYADTWAERGVRAWGEGWWEMALTTGDLLQPILGTGPGETTFHQNVTLATAIFVSALDFSGERNKLVMVDLEFPSLQYLYHRHPTARTRGGTTHHHSYSPEALSAMPFALSTPRARPLPLAARPRSRVIGHRTLRTATLAGDAVFTPSLGPLRRSRPGTPRAQGHVVVRTA